jgi:hypothetical protein
VTYARLSGTRISGENIRTGEVYLGKRIDRFDDQTTATNNRMLMGSYLGDPTFKAIGQAGGGAASGDYMFMSPNTNKMFEIRSGGDLRFRVEGSGADTPEVFIDNLDLKDLNIEGMLEIGSNGKITNPGRDFEIDSDGFTLETGQFASNALDFRDSNGNLKARLIRFNFSGDDRLRIRDKNQVTVNLDEGSAIFEFDKDKKGLSFLNVRQSHPPGDGSVLGSGEGMIYLYDGNDTDNDIELWAIARNTVGTGGGSGGTKKNKLAG